VRASVQDEPDDFDDERRSDYLDPDVLDVVVRAMEARRDVVLRFEDGGSTRVRPLEVSGADLEAMTPGGEEVGVDLLEVISAELAKPRVGRNESCPCGSGKKYKRCCLGRDATY
jgi:hypothetical protein